MNQDFETNQTPPAQQPEPLPQHSPETPPTPPAEKSKTKLILFIVAGILLVAGLVFAGYYLGTQRSDKKEDKAISIKGDGVKKDTTEVEEAPKTSETPAESVESYENWNNSSDLSVGGPALPFSFKYPGSWKHVKPGEGLSCGIIVSPTATTWTGTDSTVNMCGDGKSGQSLLSAAGTTFKDTTIASAKSLTVKGRSAVQVEGDPQTERQQTVIKLVTVIDNVTLSGNYSDIQNGVQVMTNIGYLFITGEFRGESANFEAFKKDYQSIVNSVEVK